MRSRLLFISSLAVASAGPAHAAGPVTFEMAPAPDPTNEDRWFELRATDRVREHLEVLGAVPLRRGRAGSLRIVVRVEPPTVTRAKDPVRIEARVAGTAKPYTAKGRARDLDKLSGAVALALAKGTDLELTAGIEDRWPAWRYPFSVHRFLGRAAVRMWRGEHRQAALMFGRAQELVPGLWVPEAIEGRHLAHAHLVTLAGADPNAKRDLASSAAERAQIAFKNQRGDVALDALQSFLRYSPRRARRWQLATGFDEGVILSRRSPWWVQPDPKKLWRLDPRTGVVAGRGAGQTGLVEVAQDDLITLQGRTLARTDPSGAARWSLKLSATAGPLGVVATSGLAAVLATDRVIWVDASIGERGQVARGVVPLAAGVGGVVALVPTKAKGAPPEVALLRPGKKTPAWRAAVPKPRATAMTRDRVLVIGEGGLAKLRSHDGKPVRAPLPAAAGAKILGARGRYAALAAPDGQVALIDILAAERTATVRGPGTPLAAEPAGPGVAVLFETGDLLFFDRDGKVLDRAWVPGAPRRLLAGSPVTPGPVVQTDLGLTAFADLQGLVRLERDVDGMLAAAEALLADGNKQAALRLADHVALRGAGRIAKAEGIRCRILEKRPDPASRAAAMRAERRGKRAMDPTKRVGPFEY